MLGLGFFSLGVFLILVLGLSQGWLQPYDERVLTVFHTLTSLALTRAAVAVSLLGSGWVVAPLALGAFVGLRRVSPSAGHRFALAVAGGVLLFLLVVFVIDRPRPALFDSPISEPTASFPSGHVMNTTIVFLSLYLSQVRFGLWGKRVTAWSGMILLLSVSASRLYLQIHYPSDIVAGAALGVGWVLLVFGANVKATKRAEC